MWGSSGAPPILSGAGSARPWNRRRRSWPSTMVPVNSPTTTPATLDPPTGTRAAHFWLAVVALAVGGFTIGTTEFVTMGVLPQIADGVDVSIPVAGQGHLVVRARGGHRRPPAGLLRRQAAPPAAADRPDGGLRPVQRAERAGPELRDADGRAVPRRAAARRLLRRRLAGGGEHGLPRAARPRHRTGADGAPGRQRGRRAGRDLARPDPGLAGVVLGGRPGSPRSPSRWCWRSCRTTRATPRRPAAASCRRCASRRCGSRSSPERSASVACSRCTRTSHRWPPTSVASRTRRCRSSCSPSASAWCSATGWPAWPWTGRSRRRCSAPRWRSRSRCSCRGC